MPRTYVTTSDPDDLDFFDGFGAALDQIREAAEARFGEGQVKDMGDDLVKYVYMDTDGRGAVSIVDDSEIETRFVEIEGESEAFETRVADALLPLLKIVPLPQLQREARSKKDARALKRMALGAGEEADAATLGIVRDALSSEKEAEVAAGAEAAIILQWSELVPAVDAALEGEHEKVTQRLLRAARDASSTGD